MLDPTMPLSASPKPMDTKLREAAQQLEAGFIADMLKHAQLGKTPGSFGGGVGEDQFASFLRNEQARQMAANGGIGLAQALFDALKEKAHGA